MNNINKQKILSPSLNNEWYNTNYSFYKNNSIDNLIFYKFINKLITNFFHIKEKKNLKKNSYNILYNSKPYIKFNNNKVSITLFIFNKEKFTKLKLFLYRITNIHKISNLIYFSEIYIKELENEIIRINNILKTLYVNKFKFHKNWLNILGYEISKIYNKKIEFNIINIKNYRYNSNILTQLLGSKIKLRKTNVIKLYRTILAKTFISKNYHDIYKNKLNIINFLFDNILYKNIRGISLLAKGRLTKRYKAARLVKFNNYIGGIRILNNNTFKNSKILYRNTVYSNIDYTTHKNKRRIGAFAVKGWISGKY